MWGMRHAAGGGADGGGSVQNHRNRRVVGLFLVWRLNVVQVTGRDEAMLEWLTVVRLADMDAVRWALGAYLGAGGPVGVRQAQYWVARMCSVGLLDRARPTFCDGSIVWATHQAIGKTAPNLYRQTTRHEVAVATVSARYLAQGFTWRRDRKPAGLLDHQADGVAARDGVVELVEVELTPKTWQRYKLICENHAYRLANAGIAQVTYFCTADAARIVTREADRFIFRTDRPRLIASAPFDVRGRWVGAELDPRSRPTVPGLGSVPMELDGPGGWGSLATVLE